MKYSCRFLCISVLVLLVSTEPMADDATRRNVLYIVVDDLRTELRAYGQRHMHTPHIDRLARSGLTFKRAFAQYPHCVPSRSSFLSGRRPETTGVYSIFPREMSFRDSRGATWVDLPGHFHQQGWRVFGGGKLHHTITTRHTGRPQRHWPFNVSERAYFDTSGPGDGLDRLHRQGRDCGSWCALDGSDMSAFYDYRLATDTIKALQQAESMQLSDRKPFLVMAGFIRPHTPFVVPRSTWLRYQSPDSAIEGPLASPARGYRTRSLVKPPRNLLFNETGAPLVGFAMPK